MAINNRKRILLRIISSEQDIGELLHSLEEVYGRRLYPSIPEEDRTYGIGMFRCYVTVEADG